MFRLTEVALTLTALAVAATAAAQQVIHDQVPGAQNFARIETTIACGGATKAEAMPAIRKLGFASVINVRESSEAGADVEQEGIAARAAGMHYVHVPFNIASPAPDLVERFIAAVTAPENQPAYVHCALGGRAAALWMIKRVAVDHWDETRAMNEAIALGLNDRLKPFALNYIRSLGK